MLWFPRSLPLCFCLCLIAACRADDIKPVVGDVPEDSAAPTGNNADADGSSPDDTSATPPTDSGPTDSGGTDSGPIDSGVVDGDGDGFAAHEDCDDANAEVNPGAIEICDGLDNDCDESIDDADDSLESTSTTAWHEDDDGDGYGDETEFVMACEGPEGAVAPDPAGFDCDDQDAAYHPGAPEEDCADPEDYNCDGSVSYADADGDGWAACEECNDADPAVHPDAIEICDGIDNDCNGDTDDEDDDLDTRTASTWYADADTDGFGDEDESVLACAAPAGWVTEHPAGFDCNDEDDAYHPGAVEDDCTDPEDYNCDGSVSHADADGDGWAACVECNDANSTIHPDATEVCDGIDNDCDDAIDDADTDLDLTSTSTWYGDDDDDGYGDPDAPTEACSAPDGAVDNADDCDDTDASLSPETPWYIDYDLDGHGSDAFIAYACIPDTGWVATATDCDDAAPEVHPGATEICDGQDNDCNTLTDDDDPGLDLGTASTWYSDTDGDGYGDVDGATAVYCAAPSADWVTDSTDCDDGRADIHPGATEICDASDTDEDCDGVADDDDADASGKTDAFIDADEDGFGDVSDGGTGYCDMPSTHVTDHTDCDDTRADIHPDGVEVCDDEDTDEDCDGTADDADTGGATGKVTRYPDGDGDAHGDATHPGNDYCDPPASGWVSDNTDCDDDQSEIHPDAAEICDDSDTDEDCDGAADDADLEGATGKVTRYPDSDGDAHGDADHPGTDYCDPPASGWLEDHTDCDDGQAETHPGATEVCDGSDNDCDSTVDEGLLGQGVECPAKDCNAILTDNPSAPDGSYSVNAGTETVVTVQCEMQIDGGGWTLLRGDYLALLSTGPTRNYLYTYGPGWYRTPDTTLLWNWSSYQPQGGTYTYGAGGSETATGTFGCSHGESGHWGVGCSNCGGGCWKAFPVYAKDPGAGTSTICQDQPNAFGTGACAGGVQIWEKH